MLPTRQEEEADTAEADSVYVSATRALITKVRAKQKMFPRVQDENIHYGFWRNLYAMKPIALALSRGEPCIRRGLGNCQRSPPRRRRSGRNTPGTFGRMAVRSNS